MERPDVIAISSAMSALSLALHWQRALILFQEIPARNRDIVSYGAAMTAAAVGKHWELALFWLSEMVQNLDGQLRFPQFCSFLAMNVMTAFLSVLKYVYIK